MFVLYPWGLSINYIQPLALSKTKVSFISYVWDENKLRQGAGANLHQVEMEDEDIVQNVQKGIRSRFYKHGRYSVTREQGINIFKIQLIFPGFVINDAKKVSFPVNPVDLSTEDHLIRRPVDL